MAAALKEAGKSAAIKLAQRILQPASEGLPAVVFLGPPGVGKGTYSSRVARELDLAHISVGDLVRGEIKAQSPLGLAVRIQALPPSHTAAQQVLTSPPAKRFRQGVSARKLRLATHKLKSAASGIMGAASAVARGDLLSDNIIFEVLAKRLEAGRRRGEAGFLLDGFPRTAAQAETLVDSTDVRVAVNMHLREDVLLEKCLGRRICEHCGANYNVADINRPASGSLPAVVMPPLEPKEGCREHLTTRADDNEETFRHRMEVYRQEAQPVEDIFRRAGLLLDFHITGGIPETMPSLLAALRPYQIAARRA